MSSRAVAFDVWMDGVERDAVRMDAARVARLQADGAEWIAYFGKQSTPKPEVEHAKIRLQHYQELVRLLHRSLRSALLDASEQPGAGYAHAAGTWRPAMLGRYG